MKIVLGPAETRNKFLKNETYKSWTLSPISQRAWEISSPMELRFLQVKETIHSHFKVLLTFMIADLFKYISLDKINMHVNNASFLNLISVTPNSYIECLHLICFWIHLRTYWPAKHIYISPLHLFSTVCGSFFVRPL